MDLKEPFPQQHDSLPKAEKIKKKFDFSRDICIGVDRHIAYHWPVEAIFCTSPYSFSLRRSAEALEVVARAAVDSLSIEERGLVSSLTT